MTTITPAETLTAATSTSAKAPSGPRDGYDTRRALLDELPGALFGCIALLYIVSNLAMLAQ